MENLGDVVNKAKLFDNDLRKIGLVFGANVINVLVDYSAKMDRILDEMKVHFIRLKPVRTSQPTPLDKVSNIFIKTKVLLSFNQWTAKDLLDLATPSQPPSKQSKTSRVDKTLVPSSICWSQTKSNQAKKEMQCTTTGGTKEVVRLQTFP